MIEYDCNRVLISLQTSKDTLFVITFPTQSSYKLNSRRDDKLNMTIFSTIGDINQTHYDRASRNYRDLFFFGDIEKIKIYEIIMTEEFFTYAYTDPKTQEKSYYEIHRDLIPEFSLLRSIHISDNVRRNPVEINNADIPFLYYYLNTRPIISDPKTINLLEHWGVYRNYEEIWASELRLRRQLLTPELENTIEDEISLTIMDNFQETYENFWMDYVIPDGLLFPPVDRFNPPDYQTAKSDLDYLRFLFTQAMYQEMEVVITGEYIFMVLTGIELPRIPRIEISFINAQEDKIIRYIDNVASSFPLPSNRSLNVRRGRKYITFTLTTDDMREIELVFVMMNYRTKSQALHANNIDCCCTGWDGVNIIATERARFALHHNYNTVNLDLFCERYEDLLAKYGVLGMGVYVPDLDRYVTDYDGLMRLGGVNDPSLQRSIILTTNYLNYMKIKRIEDVKQSTIDDLNNLIMLSENMKTTINEPPSRITGLSMLLLMEIMYITRKEFREQLLSLSIEGIPVSSLIRVRYHQNLFTITKPSNTGPRIIIAIEKELYDNQEISADMTTGEDIETFAEEYGTALRYGKLFPVKALNMSLYAALEQETSHWYIGKYVRSYRE